MAEGGVRAFFVVDGHPVVGEIAHLREGMKDMGVEHCGAEGAVEPLDAGVISFRSTRCEKIPNPQANPGVESTSSGHRLEMLMFRVKKPFFAN